MQFNHSMVCQQINYFCKKNNIFCVHIPNEAVGQLAKYGHHGKLKILEKEGYFKGCSDFLIYTKKELFGVEVKVKTDRQRSDQKVFQRYIEETGGKYIIVSSLEEFANEIL